VKHYRRWAIATTVATYFLIFIGGLVRVAGAGLGCPDWPKCFGRWIPPVTAQQLPPDMDPRLFNFALAWIEYVNRLIGVVIGLLILVTAILAIRYYRQKPRIWVPSIMALILVGIQGWLGGQVVASELHPGLVSVHMALAFLIVSLLIYATLQSFFEHIPPPAPNPRISKYSILVLLLWLGTIVQIILGTRLREALEILADTYPLLPSTEWLDRVVWIDFLHMGLGLILGMLIVACMFSLFRYRDALASSIYQEAWIAVILVMVQILIGLLMMVGGLVPIIQLVHLWSASLLIGVLLLLFTELRRYQHGI
jgi:cytochrome c oxidase assembly protein subunit 15